MLCQLTKYRSVLHNCFSQSTGSELPTWVSHLSIITWFGPVRQHIPAIHRKKTTKSTNPISTKLTEKRFDSRDRSPRITHRLPFVAPCVGSFSWAFQTGLGMLFRAEHGVHSHAYKSHAYKASIFFLHELILAHPSGEQHLHLHFYNAPYSIPCWRFRCPRSRRRDLYYRRIVQLGHLGRMGCVSGLVGQGLW